MKLFIFSLLFLTSTVVKSQCNTSVLDKKKFETFKDTKDRNLDIHVVVAMYNQLWLRTGKYTSEMNEYIKGKLDKPKSINLIKYIKDYEDFKKQIVNDKQAKEMLMLDKLLYCYCDFVESKYIKLQKLLKQNDTEKLASDCQKVIAELVIGIQKKYDPIVAEMKRLFNEYPLQ
ncbi:MAG: hypothetical protein QM737_10545 [Ferruginibacter sp.]